MLRTLIFDLGGVIVPLDFARGYSVLERICPYAAKDIPSRIGGTDLVRRFETGEIGPRPFFQELSELLGLEICYEEFREVWSSIFVPGSLLPDSLFAELKARGYRLVLLSNTNEIHYEIACDRYSPLKYFDDFALSYEIGAMKPSPEIYATAIEKAGCAPEECFFTDDIEAYVAGARRAGIDAVQFRSAEQLMEDLRTRGILQQG